MSCTRAGCSERAIATATLPPAPVHDRAAASGRLACDSRARRLALERNNRLTGDGMLRLLLVLATLLLTAGGAAAQCCGDCNGDGQVTINELITAVNNAQQGCGGAAQCCGDCNGDGQVTINELIAAVNNALQGCTSATPTKGHSPTPTRRPTKTPAPTRLPTKTPTPNQCPSTLTDNTSGSSALCIFAGTYNRGCGAAVTSNLSSTGTLATVVIATGLVDMPFVAFYATVVDANNAQLMAWSLDGMNFFVTAGTLQLANSGGELIIFPNDPPFMIQGCNFVQYLGNYIGQAGSQGVAASVSDVGSAAVLDRLRAWLDPPVLQRATP
jgi:hypothetical protein